ncbi:basic leucine zipper 43-like [Cucurbita maxima]|uniref:Basic leucine zipper 43-like n=1 Tax=Cucurbita maxima TaxID=3661 RepID=A0A6J1KFN2_CUCMA|nr:basic leucine zipper 43-like [Cucurbita maxima]
MLACFVICMCVMDEDLGFAENPFNELKMMMRREGDEEDESNGSCGFHREILFPSMNTNCSNVFSSPNSASCDTALDVHRHHHLSVMAERKLRRMISNRESARRSRMRKKKQIEELQYQVGQLEGSNRQLSEKLIQLLECNQQILHENAELRRKVSSLQIILTDFLTPLRSCDEPFGSSINTRRPEPDM